MAGNMVPNDILSILGVDALAEFLIQEIQMLYRLQGVRINEKHIEVILRQMLQRVDSRAGGTLFLVGDHITLEELKKGIVLHYGKENYLPKLYAFTKVLQKYLYKQIPLFLPPLSKKRLRY